MSCFKTFWNSISSGSFAEQFLTAVDTLGVTDTERHYIKSRYVNIVTNAEADYNNIKILFLFLTNFITIGGIMLVSFLSLEKINIVSTSVANSLFWTSWCISAAVAISNKTLYSFDIPRKYILNILVLERYKSEGWQFIGGVGRYSESYDIADRIQIFISEIENIKVKSLEMMMGAESDNSADAISREKPSFGADPARFETAPPNTRQIGDYIIGVHNSSDEEDLPSKPQVKPQAKMKFTPPRSKNNMTSTIGYKDGEIDNVNYLGDIAKFDKKSDKKIRKNNSAVSLPAMDLDNIVLSEDDNLSL